MRKLTTIICLTIAVHLGGTGEGWSANSSKAENAITCSALYLISSSLKQANKSVSEIQRMFEGVYSAIQRKRLNRRITNGMISEKKSELAIQLGEQYDRNPDSVVSLEMQCNAWREIIAPYLARKLGRTSNKNIIWSALRSVPDMPRVPRSSHPRWSRSEQVIHNAFAEWTKVGRITPRSFKQKLKRNLQTSVRETVKWDDLVVREGLYYKKFTAVPFTGKTAGRVQGTLRNGKRHGPWVRYYDNGQLYYKGTYKNGKWDGPYVRYYENGQFWTEGTLKVGEEDGPWVYYLPNGTVYGKRTGTFKNGVKISD